MGGGKIILSVLPGVGVREGFSPEVAVMSETLEDILRSMTIKMPGYRQVAGVEGLFIRGVFLNESTSQHG